MLGQLGAAAGCHVVRRWVSSGVLLGRDVLFGLRYVVCDLLFFWVECLHELQRDIAGTVFKRGDLRDRVPVANV